MAAQHAAARAAPRKPGGGSGRRLPGARSFFDRAPILDTQHLVVCALIISA
jgi:hypothetical protein